MKESAIVGSEVQSTFAQQGYVQLDGVFSEAECDALRVRMLEIIATQSDDSATEFTTARGTHTSDLYFYNSGDKIRFFYEKNSAREGQLNPANRPRLLNKVGHALHDLDRVFSRFSRDQRFKDLSYQLGLERAVLVQSMYIFKQPNIGGEVTCHQDGTFLASEPDAVIGFWVALEDATIDNGCLWAIPGAHREPLRRRFVRHQDECHFEEYSTQEFDLSAMVPLQIKKGGVIALHSRLPHMSYQNKSGKSRHAYTLHVMDARARYLDDNWLRRASHMPFRDFDNKKL